MRRYLIVAYDVGGLEPADVAQLELEAAVQAERSEGHAGVEVTSFVATGDGAFDLTGPSDRIKIRDPDDRVMASLTVESFPDAGIVEALLREERDVEDDARLRNAEQAEGR